jgi:antitoxin CptB
MDELARLRWQCRRGTKELDFLLNRYLEDEYLMADQKEKDLFIDLLGMEDDVLLRALMRDSFVSGMDALIGKLRAFAVDWI